MAKKKYFILSMVEAEILTLKTLTIVVYKMFE